eukprot:1312710-Prymnesium_polylepis.1
MLQRGRAFARRGDRRAARRLGRAGAHLGVVVALHPERLVKRRSITQIVQQPIHCVLRVVVEVVLANPLHRATELEVDNPFLACSGVLAAVLDGAQVVQRSIADLDVVPLLQLDKDSLEANAALDALDSSSDRERTILAMGVGAD